jgi:Fibrobacter succinogenes major domain (Fib_succ_major).
MSMRNFWLGFSFVSICGMLLVACGDDGSSTNEENYSEVSSSSEKSDDSQNGDEKELPSKDTNLDDDAVKSSPDADDSQNDDEKAILYPDAGSVYDAQNNTLTDLRDSQTYRTVVIGQQIWMAKNLNLATDSSICYDNSPENCSKYGRLYLWDDAMNGACSWGSIKTDDGPPIYGCVPSHYPVRGVCPEGWHLPDTTEWASLLKKVGAFTAGRALKSDSGWEDYTSLEFGNGLDSYSFSVLPAGIAFPDEESSSDKKSYHKGKESVFITSSGYRSSNVFSAYFDYDSYSVSIGFHLKNIMSSVRCLHDSSKIEENLTGLEIYYSSSSEEVDGVYDAENNTLTDLRDNKTYRTITVGEQVWMAENLKYDTLFSDCAYSQKGCFYIWFAALSACPSGWHLPKIDEWKTLIMSVGDSSTAGRALKTVENWNNSVFAEKGTDLVSFSAEPISHCHGYGECSYGDRGYDVGFWCVDGGRNIILSLTHDSDAISFYSAYATDAYPVRCIKN